MVDQPLAATRRNALALLAGATALPFATPTPAAKTPATTSEKKRVLQGPMLGAITPAEARLWIRCGARFDAVCEYADNPRFDRPRRSAVVATEADRDFTAVLLMTGLAPAKRYYYRILLDGAPDRYLVDIDAAAQSFVTPPAPGTPHAFRLAFGSCAKYALDPVQDIWRVIGDHRPDLFAWLGDNVYADSLHPEVFREEYRRQRDVVPLQPLLRRVPQLAIWDDHDFGSNDDDRRNPIKAETLTAFKDYWANPSAGLPDTPGVFFNHHHGGVDFFFLDGRYYRDPNLDPDVPGKTMLGRGQLAWLKDGLKASRAPFKMLVAGSGWSDARGPGGDAWSAFKCERDALFDFIRDERIEGVVLMSGDTHVGELNCIPWSGHGGYDFYDLVASPLAQAAGASWLERSPEARIRQVHFNGPNFGVIDFDLTAADPTLRFNIVNYRGELAWDDFILSASQLRNGVQSWRGAMDALSRKRQANVEAGRSYYGDR